MTSRRWFVLVALACAVYLSVLDTLGLVLFHVMQGRDPAWSDTARRDAVVWFSFLIGIPWCVFMARRLPIQASNWRSRVPLHLVGALIFCAIHIVADVFLQILAGNSQPPVTGRYLASLFGFYSAIESIVYWSIVGTLMLLDRERELRAREVRAARLETALSEARMEALRGQLAPHFLFNTLNGISALALRGDGELVTRALGDLGDLLRGALDRTTPQQIPLARELEFLDRYLALQALRFPDRLRVERAIEPGTEGALVPAFVLQPVVENAVRHGLEACGGGTVSLSASRRGDRLELAVRDTGPGFAAANVRAGIGLENTRARLTAHYGAGADLGCENLPEGGACVRLNLPYRDAPSADAAVGA